MLTLVLFLYVATAFAVHIPWGEAFARAVWPAAEVDRDYLLMVVPVPGGYQIAHNGRIYSASISLSLDLISGLSRKTMFNKELWTSSFPLYSIKPSSGNLFIKKLTRERVVPIISASVSCLNFPTIGSGLPSLPN